MLEQKDYEEIARIMQVVVESSVTPKLELLAEGQQSLRETLARLKKAQ